MIRLLSMSIKTIADKAQSHHIVIDQISRVNSASLEAQNSSYNFIHSCYDGYFTSCTEDMFDDTIEKLTDVQNEMKLLAIRTTLACIAQAGIEIPKDTLLIVQEAATIALNITLRETGKKVCSFSETCTAIVPHDWTPSDRCPDHTCPCTSGIEDGPHCLIDKWCIGDEPLTKKCNKCVRYVCREPLCHGRKCKCGEVINNR